MPIYTDIIRQLSANAYQQGIRYDLVPFQAVLSRLGNPEKSLKNIIHLAGTNGKGSTLTFIASALQSCGLLVGTYTSPHFETYTERICLNGEPIFETEFCHYFQQVREADSECTLTEFEILTAMSFLFFKDKKPDYILYETGLGGRLDATNVVTPILSIITKIGLDHQAILGDTLVQIATEKAGIIKPRVPVITLKQSGPVLQVFQQRAAECESTLTIVSSLKQVPTGYRMTAPYQRDNLALAKKALSLLSHSLDFKKVEKGLQNAQIWGRYLIKKNGSQTLVIDAAHNPQGVRALMTGLAKDFPGQKPVFIIGIYKTKDARSMLKRFEKSSSQCYYCDFEPGRSFSLSEVHNWGYTTFKEYPATDIPQLPSEALVVLTGSIYFISLFKEKLEDWGASSGE